MLFCFSHFKAIPVSGRFKSASVINNRNDNDNSSKIIDYRNFLPDKQNKVANLNSSGSRISSAGSHNLDVVLDNLKKYVCLLTLV